MPAALESAVRHVASAAKLAPRLAVVELCTLSVLYNLLRSFPQEGALKDFGSFMASGRASAAGLDPHGVYSLTYHVRVPLAGLEVDCPNLNPPISVLIFE